MTAIDMWKRALELGASTLYEANGGVGSMDPAIRPVWPGAALCGPAYPLKCAIGDNLAVHRAMERCKSGDVLVVNAGGDNSGYAGEVLANAARARGVRGVVIDGGVRDIDAFQRMGFPVFARWISMRRVSKLSRGTIGETTQVGGVDVSPGDVIVADADGVLVCVASRFEGTLRDGEARADRETGIIGRIKKGELTLDLLGLRAAADG
jgi:4-hydroxy-4-methyl-2-oxoglutarate aldolase